MRCRRRVRRKRINTAFRKASPSDLRAFDAERDRDGWATMLDLAERWRVMLYDATYLEPAQRVRLPLAMLDQELRVAGGTLGLSLLGS